jgi:hypothetical protein
MAVRAPLVAALPRCAVSQNCIPQCIGEIGRLAISRSAADYKSALRQSENLRDPAQE